jgi:RNA polymerase sigma-70 factor (ECF subfamily)
MLSAATFDGFSILPDETVVAQVLDGDTALFEVLMRRHNQRLFRAARAILRDGAEAEDVMQQAYVNAYVNLRQFDGRASFATWLTRIAVNEALARARSSRRYQPIDDAEGVPENVVPFPAMLDPERHACVLELGAILETAIDALPDGLREVFMLRDVQGLSTAETASSLGVSEDVVRTRLSRSRARLRCHLSDRAGVTAAQCFTFLKPRCDFIVAAVLARIG